MRVIGWAYSSAGEHYIDIVGVTGSIPVTPTIRISIKSNIYENYALTILKHIKCYSQNTHNRYDLTTLPPFVKPMQSIGGHMGIFAQILGTLTMFAGVMIGGVGFMITHGGGLVTLPYGAAIFISGVLMVCLGLIVDHLRWIRITQEKQLELLAEMQAKK